MRFLDILGLGCPDVCELGDVTCELRGIALSPTGDEYLDQEEFRVAVKRSNLVWRLLPQREFREPGKLLLKLIVEIGLAMSNMIRDDQMRRMGAFLYAVVSWQKCEKVSCWFFWERKAYVEKRFIVRIPPSPQWRLPIHQWSWNYYKIKKEENSGALNEYINRKIHEWCRNKDW